MGASEPALLDDPALTALVARVRQAREARTPLDIRGGDSKRFYGGPPAGEPFDVAGLAGISSYEPTELVVTARCGTRLADLEAALAAHGQCLPFEPPRLGPAGTVGGMVAAGLAGPSRATAGSVRDHVLGATLLNGRGEVLTFGGQVMKNVAGYDVARVLAGSLGVLGVILEVSLKVLPRAPHAATLRFEFDEAQALHRLAAWGARPLPLDASAWWAGALVVRLRGAAPAVEAAATALGGERIEPRLAAAFWDGLRDQRDDFFLGAAAAIEAAPEARLWRLALPPTAPPLPGLSGEQLIEWGGAQRWLCSAAAPAQVREAAARSGGHATLYRARDKAPGAFAPLSAPLERLHRGLKAAFDPERVFNPGRLYPGL